MSGMNGWLTLGAWRRPSVSSVSSDIMFLDWNIAVLRRREVRGVDADMVSLRKGDPALRRSQFETQDRVTMSL